MPDATLKTKVVAVLALMSVQITVGVLYRVSQATGGGFHFSTMSAIAIAESGKFCISMGMHIADPAHREAGSGKLATAAASASSQLSVTAVLHILSLSFLYALNNQLAFYVATMADPGTIFLFKAANALIVASIQVVCVGKRFSGEQVRSMFLQMVGIIIVQHDPCSGHARYAPFVYGLMAFSITITSVCSVRNEYLVKNYSISMNVQNCVLYGGGAGLNVMAFFFLPNPSSKQAGIGFFDGYNEPMALGVVLCNTLIGIAINFVYKYADAVLKCISTDCTAVVLCIVSSVFFNLKPSLTFWCGVFVVCYAVYSYSMAPGAPPKPAAEARELRDRVAADGIDSEGGEDEAVMLGKPTASA